VCNYTLLETLTPWKGCRKEPQNLSPNFLSFYMNLDSENLIFTRRRHGDLIEMYKLLKGYYDVDWPKFFTFSPVHQTRGHQLKLCKKPARLQLRAKFFTQIVVYEWNSLPSDVVLVPTISLFKHKLWTCFGKRKDGDTNKGLVPKTVYFWHYHCMYIH